MAGMRPTAAPKEPPAIKPRALGKGGFFGVKTKSPRCDFSGRKNNHMQKRSSFSSKDPPHVSVWRFQDIYTRMMCDISKNRETSGTLPKAGSSTQDIRMNGTRKNRYHCIIQKMCVFPIFLMDVFSPSLKNPSFPPPCCAGHLRPPSFLAPFVCPSRANPPTNKHQVPRTPPPVLPTAAPPKALSKVTWTWGSWHEGHDDHLPWVETR